MCGFSRFVSEILKFYKINDFSYMNVLAQEDLRSIIKKATDWPTFP
jgi:glutaredoxin-related protein